MTRNLAEPLLNYIPAKQHRPHVRIMRAPRLRGLHHNDVIAKTQRFIVAVNALILSI